MNEEPTQFPRANDPNFIFGIITSQLSNKGYTIQQIGNEVGSKNFSVTTKEKVTEKDMSEIRMSVESRGYTIEFSTV